MARNLSPLTLGLLTGAAQSAKYDTAGGGLLGGLSGFGQGYSQQANRLTQRRAQEAQNEWRQMRTRQLEREMQRQREQREQRNKALFGGMEPQGLHARSVEEATAPGPGGMASGGRTGPSQAQMQQAQNVQMRKEGLLGTMPKQVGLLVQSMPADQRSQFLADYMTRQPSQPDLPNIVQEAQYLYPNDRAKQRAFIEQYRQDGGQTINVNAGERQSAFREELAKNRAKRVDEVQKGGQRAVQTERMVDRMADILTNKGLQTGAVQPLVTQLQNIGQSVGIPVRDVADSMGINLNKLGSAEEFQRLQRGLAKNKLAEFKGNTSNRELDFAQSQVANLGTSPEGNIRALAAMKAAAQIARENAERASLITDPDDYARFEKEYLNRGTERIRELTNQYEKQLRERMDLGRDASGNENVTQTPSGERKHDLSPEDIQTMDITDIPPVQKLTPAQQDALDKRLKKEGY